MMTSACADSIVTGSSKVTAISPGDDVIVALADGEVETRRAWASTTRAPSCSTRASAWQLQSKPGYTVPFSLKYIPDNVVHAIGFFFGKPTDQPNSYVFSALGCIALGFFILLAAKKLRALQAESPVSVATLFFAFGFAAQLGLMMCYFWGQFDDAIIRRLSLPTHLWMVVALLAVLPQFPKPAVVKTLLGVAAAAPSLSHAARKRPSRARTLLPRSRCALTSVSRSPSSWRRWRVRCRRHRAVLRGDPGPIMAGEGGQTRWPKEAIEPAEAGTTYC